VKETPSDQVQEWVAQAQHDLRNPLGNLLCSCEMLLAQREPPSREELRTGLENISELSNQLLLAIDQTLDPDGTPPAPVEIQSLQTTLQDLTSRILDALRQLSEHARAAHHHALAEDCARMLESAGRIAAAAGNLLRSYPAKPTVQIPRAEHSPDD
jgi:signal transduction histidine kinase